MCLLLLERGESLSQIYDFYFGEVFCIEAEEGIVLTAYVLQRVDVDVAPVATVGAETNALRMVRIFIDGDERFLDGVAIVGSRKMNFVATSFVGEGSVVSLLVEMDEIDGIDTSDL